ncbi:MAG TPA: putative aminohydrolase SsnA [Candidatus Ozemobacteraceae bacterium]|nr:putative aminohydrolase SsnA [Candidatus Ozemobacteraceae bacterium]
MKIIGHGTILTFGSDHRVIQDGAVAYDDERIHAVGTTEEIKKRFSKAKVRNVHGRVITPGLVNAHMHLYSTFARGMALKDEAPENFVQILERLWWRLDRALTLEDLELTAMIPLLQAVRSGVTTLVDHHASPHALAGSLDILKKAFRRVGVRGCLCYEVSDRDGASRRDAGLEENANFIRGIKLGDTNDIAGMIGLHASFTLEDTTLARAAELAKALKVGVHIHVAEDKSDVEDAKRRGFRSPVDRLHRAGLTGPDSIFAHCVHADSLDIQTLALTRTNVIHNPRSNMNNAVGCAKIEDMIKERVPVAFGTDGMSPSPLPDLYTASLIHKHQAGDPRKGWSYLWKMFSQNTPAVASTVLRTPLGLLEAGAGSDIVVWDYIPPTPISDGNTLGHFLFGLSEARVNTTICQGKTLFEDNKLTFLDDSEEIELHAKARELAQALWERF